MRDKRWLALFLLLGGWLGGFLFGVGVGAGRALRAQALKMAATCGTGYLHGWTVEAGGDEVCSSPFAWGAVKTIECE